MNYIPKNISTLIHLYDEHKNALGYSSGPGPVAAKFQIQVLSEFESMSFRIWNIDFPLFVPQS